MSIESRIIAALDAQLGAASITPNTIAPARPIKRGTTTRASEIQRGQSLALPEYSHKAYDQAPTVVYTRNEEETNDLVPTMRGYVRHYYIIYISRILHIHPDSDASASRPLGFDMEWKIFPLEGGGYFSRRTALIQLCDGNIILLVQLSAMKSKSDSVRQMV
jgi:hypothetical protein